MEVQHAWGTVERMYAEGKKQNVGARLANIPYVLLAERSMRETKTQLEKIRNS